MISKQYAIASGFNAEDGTKNFRFETRGSHSSLHDFIRIGKGVRRALIDADSQFIIATHSPHPDARFHRQSEAHARHPAGARK